MIIHFEDLQKDFNSRSKDLTNKKLYTQNDGYSPDKGLKRVASIPTIILEIWAKEYNGKAMVVYGHTPVPHAEWLNNTIDIDTGCVFVGSLTAWRYPEKELLSIKAKKTYCEPAKPITPIGETKLNAQQENDDLLHIEDVIGKRFISTRFNANITIREEQAIAALEVMSRFAVNPKWLTYRPISIIDMYKNGSTNKVSKICIHTRIKTMNFITKNSHAAAA